MREPSFRPLFLCLVLALVFPALPLCGELMREGDASALDLYQEALDELSGSEDKDPDRQEAILLLKEAVEIGYAPAMNLLGNLYLERGALFPSPRKANRLFQQASELNDPIASFNLAYSYRHGRGVKTDFKKAEELFIGVVEPTVPHAIEPEHFDTYRVTRSSAYYNLAGLYDSENVIEKDKKKAIAFAKEAEELGHATAAMYLAVNYAIGDEIEKNLELANHYLERYNLYAQNDYRLSFSNTFFLGMDQDLDHLVENLATEIANDLDERLVDAQVSFGISLLKEGEDYDPENGFRWLSMAEEKSEVAQLRLARLYFRGEGVAEDRVKARKLLEDLGSRFSVGAYNLGVMRFHGYGGEQDEVTAKSSLQLAAEKGLYVASRYLRDGGELEFFSYDECLQQAETAARAEDPDAIYSMGYRHYYGFGVDQDREKSRELLRVAAEGEVAAAQYMLGTRFSGILDDLYTKNWVNAAANQGYLPAINFKAEMHAGGRYYRKDIAEAVRLYRECVAAGYPKSMRNLGMLYRKGEGLLKDYEKSLKLLNDAAELGDPLAMLDIGEAYLNGYGVDVDLIVARDWMLKSSQSGSIRAYFELGKLYESGLNGEPEWGRAVENYREASDYLHIGAMLAMGQCYENGFGVEKSRIQALDFYGKAAYFGNSNDARYRIAVLNSDPDWTNADIAMALQSFRSLEYYTYIPAVYQLGLLNLKGHGLKQNDRKAYLKFKRVASYSEAFLEMKIGGRFDDGDDDFVAPNRDGMSEIQSDELDRVSSESSYQLGLLCLQSSHRKVRDPAEGLLWLEAAARQNHKAATAELANQYRENDLLRGQTKNADKWIRKAAESGDPVSQYELAKNYFEQGRFDEGKNEAVNFLKNAASNGYEPAKQLLVEQGISFEEKEGESNPRESNEEEREWDDEILDLNIS
ncbi:hypothetical protein MLD52_07895 [Puniceicoccaceae bacterium K14]|nr:hypothetical protein [Puniceicoccaceae bacterium K14]